MLSGTLLNYFNQITSIPSQQTFPAPLSAEGAEIFQKTLMEEFDKALVYHLLLVKFTKNIHKEQKLTADDRAYIDNYFAIYKTLKTSCALLIAVYIFQKSKEPMTLLFWLSVATFLATVNSQRSEIIADTIAKNIKPYFTDPDYWPSLLMPEVRFIATAAVLFSLYCLEKLGSALIYETTGKSSFRFVIFSLYNLTLHFPIQFFTPLLTLKIMAYHGRNEPTAMSEAEQARASTRQLPGNHQEINTTADEALSPVQANIRQLEKEADVRHQNLWRSNPDNISSSRYQLSLKVNPIGSSGNNLWLPGYKGNAEDQANQHYKKHEEENTLEELKAEVEGNISTLDTIVESALQKLPAADMALLQKHFNIVDAENLYSDITSYIVKQLMLIILCYSYQYSSASKAEEMYKSPKYDFLYSVITQGHTFIPIKQHCLPVNDSDKAILDNSRTNIIDYTGEAAVNTRQAPGKLQRFFHGQLSREELAPSNLRLQIKSSQLYGFIDTENFFHLVTTLSKCSGSLFNPIENHKAADAATSTVLAAGNVPRDVGTETKKMN